MDKLYDYYIYHIKGIKIGLTTNIEYRIKEQGFVEYELLLHEQGDYEYGWVMGNKELELQKQYGYKVDNSHYMVSKKNRHKWGDDRQAEYSKLNKNRYKFNNTFEQNSMYAKQNWLNNRDVMLNAARENIKKATIVAATSPNRASLQTFYCSECDREIIGAGPAGRHRKNKQHKVDKIKP